MRQTYYVYILTNRHHTVLYTGVTNDIRRRVGEHRDGRGSRFTNRYNVNRLVYLEEFAEASQAIAREKQIKAGSRQKKIELVNSMNEGWRDLGDDLF